MGRLFALVGCVLGLALTAPVIWFALHRRTHPDTSVDMVAVVFFVLVALLGLSIAVRSAWRAIKGDPPNARSEP